MYVKHAYITQLLLSETPWWDSHIFINTPTLRDCIQSIKYIKDICVSLNCVLIASRCACPSTQYIYIHICHPHHRHHTCCANFRRQLSLFLPPAPVQVSVQTVPLLGDPQQTGCKVRNCELQATGNSPNEPDVLNVDPPWPAPRFLDLQANHQNQTRSAINLWVPF